MYTHNFCAGPCVLPKSVLKKAAESMIDFHDGLSIVEISHRSKEFVAVMENAVNLVKKALNVPDGYEVLFLQGGASTQFCMVPYNLLGDGEKAAYLETGTWAKKAIKESKLFGETEVIASSSDKNFNYIPTIERVDGAKYFHCTSNNTIFGTQMHSFPEVEGLMVCDMSSDIFSRQIDVSKFDLIYAGAQKNLGPAGATLVIIKKDILGTVERAIPSMLDYKNHIDKDSMFNTPSCYAVYVSMLTLEWIEANGGVASMETKNNEKARLLYEEIDRNTLFEGTAEKESRSRMNATFVLKNDSLQDDFLKACDEAGIYGIKGHRSVGGFRASMYNALEIESVQVLVEVMKKFEEVHISASV